MVPVSREGVRSARSYSVWWRDLRLPQMSSTRARQSARATTQSGLEPVAEAACPAWRQRGSSGRLAAKAEGDALEDIPGACESLSETGYGDGTQRQPLILGSPSENAPRTTVAPVCRQYGMYGPPPYCKRKDEGDRIGLRECIRPLLE